MTQSSKFQSYKLDCRYFSGYKPCKFKRACEGCPHFDGIATRILVISLEALGAVLRSTVLLKPIMDKYPKCYITWVTLPSARSLLENNPHIDKLLTLEAKNLPLILAMNFDVAMGVDKSAESGALLAQVTATTKLGFGVNEFGVIVPMNDEAHYQYDVGLDDELKFRINQKPETQQITETMALPWRRDEYILQLTPEEQSVAKGYRERLLEPAPGAKARGVIGYNTGCSYLYPYKKFTVERSIEIIKAWRRAYPDFTVALLGGREDMERQAAMKAAFQSDPYVVNTPCDGGLRNGVLWMEATDLVLSGCSLGMHIAIGLKKHVIAWFGVSCIQEVDLYDRGFKIQSDVSCSPCWRKSCQNEPKCFNRVEPETIERHTGTILRKLKHL